MKSDKKKEYLNWDDTFILMANLISQRSKDPNTQTGACIVNDENIVIGLGYNGFPRGCHDDKLPWCREGDVLKTKYAYVVHAEANALLNSVSDTRGCRLYCHLFPCNECAKLIIQSGIKEVIYESDKYKEMDIFKASRKMLKMAGIKLRHYSPRYELIFKKRSK
jgi:dCMP deaminase